jgi:hypothetical protein
MVLSTLLHLSPASTISKLSARSLRYVRHRQKAEKIAVLDRSMTKDAPNMVETETQR